VKQLMLPSTGDWQLEHQYRRIEPLIESRWVKPRFLNRGPRAPLGATERFSGGREQRP